MQPRFAALLFVLGLADLAYVNLGLGHEVFGDAASGAANSPAPRALEPARAPNPPPEPVAAPEAAPTPGEETSVTAPSTPAPALPSSTPPAAEAPAAEAMALPEPSPPIEPPGGEPAPSVEPAQRPDAPGEPAPSADAVPGSPRPARAGVEAAPAARGDVAIARPTTGAPPSADAHSAGTQPLRDIEPSRDAEPVAPVARAAGLPDAELTVPFADTASAGLSEEARAQLLELAAKLRAHPDYRIQIVGHADARGTREFNLDLGGRRARAVTELLLGAGVSREQLQMESRGEDQPRVIGNSEQTWAANRRVEISIGVQRSTTP